MILASLPEKLNYDCSIIHLIDEDLCLDKSVDVINYNVEALSYSLSSLEEKAINWNALYSLFSSNSAAWLSVTSNLKNFGERWNTAHNTVKQLSSNWSMEFSLVFPTVISFDDWYTNSNYINLSIPNWLNANFISSNYTEGQTVSVYVNLFKDYNFSYTFARKLEEPCTPTGGGATINCINCRDYGVGIPSRGCNHHGGAAGWGPCDNAYEHCTYTTPTLYASAPCSSSGAKTLSISYSLTGADSTTARIVRQRYKNTNNSWNLIT
jgi:hypothetical protein